MRDQCWQRAMNAIDREGRLCTTCRVNHTGRDARGWPVDAPCRPGDVYLARVWPARNLFKVGCAEAGAHQRIESLRAREFPGIVLVAYAPSPCGLGAERFLHAALLEYHVERELFRLEEPLTMIASLPPFEGAPLSWHLPEAA